MSDSTILSRNGQAAQLHVATKGSAEILVNLNWNHRSKSARSLSGGLQQSTASGIDLDLACFYELSDGDRGAVQALSRLSGSFDCRPFIMHCGDDRAGSWPQGENLRINGARATDIRRVLIYAYIYHGAANWSQADAVISVKQAGAPDIIIRLDEFEDGLSTCAVAAFENSGSSFRMERLVRYFPDQRSLDEALEWGFRWTRGAKRSGGF